MPAGRRGLLVVAAAAVAVFVVATPASAQSFTFPEVDAEVTLLADGSVEVAEHLSFAFDGDFSGAYRDIPLRRGENISDVTVSEGGLAYAPGASTELGSFDDPGTFGVEDRESVTRVVWHYSAFSERRTFTITYRMTGLAVAYDDVVDVNLQVWGEEWDTGVDRLTATFTYPGAVAAGEVRVFGHPSTVAGETSLGADGLTPTLSASDVPTRQFVEMRVVLPRAVLTSTDGASVIAGDGLAGILDEEAAEADRANSERRADRGSLFTLAGLLALVPNTLFGGYLRFGREPRVAYDREYEQSPPSEHGPAMVAGLRSQGRVDEAAFTATMFDLIRKGALAATPTTVERKTWFGLRTEQISDLELAVAPPTGDSPKLDDVEAEVMEVMRRVLGEGPVALTEFRTKIRENPSANHESFVAFAAKAKKRLITDKLLDDTGRYVPWLVAAAVVGVGLLGWFVITPLLDRFTTIFDPVLLRTGLVIFGVLGIGFAVVSGNNRRAWVRRSSAGALLDARWNAFRSYLRDFGRFEEAPAISIALWEEYLVYAIAFGVADEVLTAARIVAPPELQQSSSLYWYGDHGYTSGHSSNAISGIGSSLQGAFSAPSS
ncbi:MAG: DUF2207 domain-containing protein, partial [Actinomycetota bacterium]|nr:DUF2207 domain-containing protein [Actinomycetota bacterium]